MPPPPPSIKKTRRSVPPPPPPIPVPETLNVPLNVLQNGETQVKEVTKHRRNVPPPPPPPMPQPRSVRAEHAHQQQLQPQQPSTSSSSRSRSLLQPKSQPRSRSQSRSRSSSPRPSPHPLVQPPLPGLHAILSTESSVSSSSSSTSSSFTFPPPPQSSGNNDDAGARTMSSISGSGSGSGSISPTPSASAGTGTGTGTGTQETTRILVMARIRPRNTMELSDEHGQGKIVVYTKHTQSKQHTNKSTSSVNIPTIIGVNTNDITSTNSKNSKEYKLDGIFPPTSTQDDVFQAVIPLLNGALEGFNCTIFTYGQTGTGKTHTMVNGGLDDLDDYDGGENLNFNGDYDARSDERGIIPRTTQYIFQKLNALTTSSSSRGRGTKVGCTYTVTVSYTEIYNERVIDLLNVKEDNMSDMTMNMNMNVTMNNTFVGMERERDRERDKISIVGSGAASMTPSKNKGGPSNFGKYESEDRSLEIREDKALGIIVVGLTEVAVANEYDVLEVLARGAKGRAMASTNMNERSSRSHTILCIRVTVTTPYTDTNTTDTNTDTNDDNNNDDNTIQKTSKINLVDLAGSERYKTHQMAKFSEIRIRELTSINQSLSSLGNCIAALTKRSGSGSGLDGKGSSGGSSGGSKEYVPYRNSKLTRILQDSLSGSTRTLFIVTLSPSQCSSEETISTLQFADRAMRVRVFASVNERFLGGEKGLLRIKDGEIGRLKGLLQAALANSEHSSALTLSKNNNGGSGKMNTVIAETITQDNTNALLEASILRDENLKLAEEVSKLRNDLNREKSEKAKLLEAIYEATGSGSGSNNNSSNSNSSGGSGSLNPSSIIPSLGSTQTQLRILNAQRQHLDARQVELDTVHVDQEERWEWLDSYHSWLRNLPISKGLDHGGDHGDDDDHDDEHDVDDGSSSNSNNGETKKTNSIYDRLCMMETSLQLQSAELKRTKRLFLRDKEKLEQQILRHLEHGETKDGEIDGFKGRVGEVERECGVLRREKEELVECLKAFEGNENSNDNKRNGRNKKEEYIKDAKISVADYANAPSTPNSSTNKQQQQQYQNQITPKQPLKSALKKPKQQQQPTNINSTPSYIAFTPDVLGLGFVTSPISSSNGGGGGRGGEWDDHVTSNSNSNSRGQRDTEMNVNVNVNTSLSNMSGKAKKTTMKTNSNTKQKGEVEGEGESEWTEHYHKEYGVPYYFNKKTKLTVWEVPEGI